MYKILFSTNFKFHIAFVSILFLQKKCPTLKKSENLYLFIDSWFNGFSLLWL